MNLEEALAKRPADEQAVAAQKSRMKQELAAAEMSPAPDPKYIWRHSDWD